jgi:hypothetical protein
MTADRFIPEIIEVTIAASGTTSDAVNLSGLQLVAIETPSALTGTALTFTASVSLGGTYDAVREVGGAAAYSLTMAANQWIPVSVNVFAGVPFLKIVSGSTEAAARTFNLICRPVS